MTTAPAQSEYPTIPPEGADHPLLTVENLAVSFPGGGPRLLAVDGASFNVYPRQTLAIVGESGCGKSVSAMSILGLVPSPPSRVETGRILYHDASGTKTDLVGLDHARLRRIRGSDIAMIFQEPMTSLNPVYTVGQQIIEAIELHAEGARAKRPAKDIAVEAMEAVGIRDARKRLHAYPHEFSGGMRQRVMIAMALACEPRLLIADEPTTALDVTVQAQILDLIDDLKRDRGLGVILITHDLGVVAQHADVVCVMYAGRVVEYGSVTRVYETPLHPYTRALLACIPRMDVRRDRLATVADMTGELIAKPIESGPLAGRQPWWPWASGLDPRGAVEFYRVRADHWVTVRAEA